ncbi:putative LRR receptor-like serine/threonine-protein kinase [Arachis hypogaea]|uniref:Putative LRR receptor-like serine/threonine-protein kinase n=1 Tax=Arachis hypogaea TaxID=3818 RepID=A0A6B9V412_ARAHY|nr:putative LRR receptor-like serine/threonine-protein kinase [Arachis hypogaea]
MHAMAKKIANSLFLLLGALSFIAMVQGQDQSGFISIDCGLPENSNYTEKNIGINYISDANFIDSGVSKTVSPQDNGVSKTVSPQDKTTHPQYFNYLRSFPNGIRNCYRINVTSVTRYLIRASFLYGNYDGLNKLPEFDLYLGVHFWETVKFTNSSVSINYEIIHTLSLNYIHICLVNKGTGTPFISVIEMRILGNVEKSYVTIESSTSLARFRRLYFSSISNLIYRYEDDPYNRIWEPYWENNWRLISSNHSNYALDQDPFNPPAVVLKTAATSINATASLDFHWDIDDNETQHQYYFYLHLTELQHLGADQTRSFNINMDGKTWNTAESLKYGKVYTKHVRGLSSGCKKCHISLIRTESSTLPPIISALEIYLAKNFSSQSEIDKDDVETGKEIHVFPDAYKWQGVDCSTIDGFLRITSLNLSSSGLTGHIRTDISKLTMLKDLSDNGLSGNIPNFLVQLQSLEYLNLAHNNLTAGSVSNELLQKQSDGQLTLSVRQNPNLLCGTTSCTLQTNATRKKKNNAVITVVASIAGILLLLGIAAVIIGRIGYTLNPYPTLPAGIPGLYPTLPAAPTLPERVRPGWVPASRV